MPMLHRAISVNGVGKTPLMDAVIRKDVDRVDALILDLDLDVNEQDDFGWTALQLAAAHGCLDIIHKLLDRGAKPDIGNKGGRTPLMYAAALGYTEIVKVLLDVGANPNVVSHDPEGEEKDLWGVEGETALMLASWSGHKQIMRLLLEAGADVNARGGPFGGTALHSALWEGFQNSIEALLESPDVDLSLTDSEGLTAKEAAKKQGRMEIARLLEQAESERMARV